MTPLNRFVHRAWVWFWIVVVILVLGGVLDAAGVIA